MKERKQIYGNIFIAVSSVGALFVLAEIVMQSLGRSICFTEGCKIAAQTVRFGESSILIIGLLMFSSSAVLAVFSRIYTMPPLERLINFIIIVSLACEGFFMGYLTFRLSTVCIFCVVVFSLLVILGVLRLLSREYEVVAGFAALAAIFSLLYLVLPAGTIAKLPENERLVLFYSKDCKYCAEIMTEIENNKISVKHVEVNGYAALLKSMGIEHVPTLLVNEPYQKVFFTGKDAIRRYLQVCTAKSTAENPATRKKSGKTADPAKAADTELKLDIFTQQQGILRRPGETAPGEGLCKEDEICK
jgi:hypothetical protein